MSCSSNVAITIRTLEIFRVTQLCCPRLGVQVFVRALCDIHGVPTRPYLGAQFSVAFDVDKRTQAALGRDTANWRLNNACPCCLYKLEGEAALHIPLLCTFDGNNSLARFWRREREWVNDSGVAVPGASKERRDDRVAPGDRYLPREEAGTGADDPDDDGCNERWANMKEDVTARAYGMYDETGFFPCLCRHSFLLVAVDMVKSGELAKYGFAITAHLLNVLGEVATGYNIGCKLGKMVRMHPVLSPLASANNYKSLVGAFHGHAHCRRCQLKNLTTYVEGVGLEDLKECESFFSKSNALASRTRYSTAFHRQQAITTYLKHADTVDAYHSLSTVLANKYRRALKIKATLPMLRETMASLGVGTRSVFETWLEKEKTYLNSLTKEPAQETLQMEYYQKLVNLHDHEGSQTQRIETQRQHAAELVSKTLAAVQDLELRLGIAKRWERDGADWTATALMVTNRRYQCALDELEGLVVARMFELSKVHMADTGYKLRKHIAKALQARSKGVRSALDRYNDAAVMLSPPRTMLSWEQIVDYAFLADFDLLREGREDIRSEPWAQPAGAPCHGSALQAPSLNIEIPCLITYMVDEERFLAEGKEALAYQVKVQRVDRAHFNGVHLERLTKLSKEDGFTASISPGVSISKERTIPEAVPGDVEDVEMQEPPRRAVSVPPQPDEEDDGEDEDADIDGEAIADAFETIVRIAHNRPAPAPAL
ncbi:hypothetical protein B0H14DRAFT_3080808 [Mycena olivaceomarginata]|nr:hypothetical protein B0H14DRAFT_3080808 [Mycena olivaceomarginata]